MSKSSCVTLFPEVETVTRKLSDQQFGILIRAVIAYRFRGEVYDGEDAALDIAFQFLANQVDRSEIVKSKKARAAEVRWNASSMQGDAEAMQNNAEAISSDAEAMQNDAPILSNPIRSDPIRSDPIQSNPIQNISNTLSPAGAAEKRAYGKYGWITLTDQEYAQLQRELGDQELKRCIQYVDESAQANGNRNGWQDFAVILTKCSREGWGVKKARKKKEEIPKGASGVLGEAELGFIQNALRGEV